MSYELTWGSPLGKSCIDLKSALSNWLGTRLIFLGDNTRGIPIDDDGQNKFADWNNDLKRHGHALKRYARFRGWKTDATDVGFTDDQVDDEAVDAMVFVAKAFHHLWD